MKKTVLLFLCILFSSGVFSQNVGINISGAAPHAGAILDVDAAGMSPKAGVLMPRMTTVQRDAIPSPANGLLVYNVTTNQINFYNGSYWRSFTDVLSSATVAGGTGTTQGVAINTTGNEADPSALLDITSTTQGLLVPRTIENSITSPVAGLVIFSTTSNDITYYNGSTWQYTCDAGSTSAAGGSQSAKGTSINATGATGHQSAIFDLGGTTKGFLLPRVTDAERDAIPTPAQGLVIYNSTTNTIEFFNNTEWRTIQNGVGFKTEWTTTAPAQTITLPLVNSGGAAYNCTVHWGDATSSVITAWNDADKVHSYAAAGTYTVEIVGQCEGWSFNNGGDRLKIKKVLSWGDACTFNGFKYLQNGFYGCTALTSLPATGGILASGTGCANFSRTFRNCSGLTAAIPTDLFRYNTSVSTDAFYETFYGCSGLTGAIPSDLFRYNTLVSSQGFRSTFYNCSWLTGVIPTDLFRYNTLVSTQGFSTTFQSCVRLTTIPSDLFRYNTLVSTYAFSGTFAFCLGLTSIPSDLFKYNTLVSDGAFNGTFNSCTGLTGSIPIDLFRYNTLAATYGFYSTFTNCSGLTGAIPTDLFSYNTLVSDYGFNSTFTNCSGLTGAIPPDLFRYNTLVSTLGFYDTFRNCIGLTSIPPDLFRYNTLVSTEGFYQTFYGCAGLTSIPTDLFKYNTTVSISGFNATFRGCTGLTGSIPTDLFRYNTLVSTLGFYQTFYGCLGLTGTIPTDLFRYNTVVSTSGFYQTFYGCLGLTGAIPPDLFRYNTAVSTSGFLGTFWGCSGLTSVPTDLFKYNTACLSFNSTFYGCTNLQLNRNIFFADGEEATRFLNQSVNFTSCFERASYTGVQGEAPYLWLCNFGTGTATKTSCFGGAGNSTTSLTNYPDELITLDVAPASDWVPTDVITGQTSARTCTVVSKITATTYIVNARGGLNYTLGEIIGVTADPTKLADQGAARPTFAASGWR